MIYDRQPKRRPAFNIADVPPLAYVGGACVMVLVVAAFVMTRPSEAEMRIKSLERQIASIQSAALSDGDLSAYPLGSVCTSTLDDGFRNQLTSALANSGLKIDALDIRSQGKVDGRRPLTGYGFVLKASGSYEQAVGALEILAHYKPRLFLDSLSLRNQTSSVDLNVEGRLYCRWTKRD